METHKFKVLLFAAALIAAVHCYPAQESSNSESTESTDKKEDVDTVLVLPGSNPFGIRPIRPIQPIFGIPDLDDDSFEGISSPGYFNPFRSNPFDGFVASMQSMMNRLREQMATMLSSRFGQGGGLLPWSGKIPEGANTTSTTKIIDGHVVTINETTFLDGDGNNQAVLRVRTIDVKPEVTINKEDSDAEVATPNTTPNNEEKEETTVPPRSIESFEDSNDNEIPKNQVDTLTA